MGRSDSGVVADAGIANNIAQVKNSVVIKRRTLLVPSITRKKAQGFVIKKLTAG